MAPCENCGSLLCDLTSASLDPLIGEKVATEDGFAAFARLANARRDCQRRMSKRSPRPATIADLDALHTLGLATLELQVSAAPFMTRDELAAVLVSPATVCLVANGGFVLASIGDPDHPTPGGACIVYLAVHPEHRRRGVATALVNACLAELAARGVTSVYLWADPNSGVIEMMERCGFERGKSCVWMSKGTP